MPNPINCPLCRVPATFRPINVDLKQVKCARCGTYDLTGTGEAVLDARPIQNVGAVSGWIRHQNAMGLTPSLHGDNVEDLRVLAKPSFRERAERFLIEAAQKAPKLDRYFKPGAPEFIGVTCSDDTNELVVIIDYLRDEGLLTRSNDTAGERLTPKGYISADDLRTRRAASTQAFVAMWFTNEMKAVYNNGIEPGIRNAGYKALIISNKEHANKIDDEIIAEIRRSAFLVADFTGHRQNVYFECGFAIGLGLQPIWTCRKDHIEDLHFDIRQYNSIDWQNEAELARRLTNRIVAMFGQGPLAPS